MLLPTRDGIICDLCGDQHKDKFIYYSVSGNKIMVNHSASSVVPIGKDVDLDVCEGCYGDLISRASKNTGIVRNGIKCNLTSEVLIGAFEYWKLVFDKVEVNTSNQETTNVFHKVMDLDIGPRALNELRTKKSAVAGASR